MSKNIIRKKAMHVYISEFVKQEFDDFCKKNGLKHGLVLERLIILLLKKNKDAK